MCGVSSLLAFRFPIIYEEVRLQLHCILSEVHLLRLDDVVGGDVLLLHVPQVGLDAGRIVSKSLDEGVAQNTSLG